MNRIGTAHRAHRRIAIVLFVCAVIARPAGGDDGSETAAFDAPLAVTPLAEPLVLNGGFCEFRRGHFHGGYDLGTDRRVGRPVRAPGSGWIARVRASGVGYGRSIYLHTDDGRLLVLAHLDAFAGPLAAYVRERQDSTGVYEQDLWPDARRFRVAAGDTIAWTGESGAGGPHLHIEIRRGDMAYHPQRAGLAVADTAAPTLTTLVLEPLDEHSFVNGSAQPRTFSLDRAETLAVIGRLRAIVGARDGVWAGVDRMVPWSVGMTWNGRRTECRFDSVSWATDMEQSDFVYDSGRVVDSKGILLWAPAGFRPRVIRSDEPAHEEAGTIVVRPGDPPRPLTVWARDLGGGTTERTVVLKPSRVTHKRPPALGRGGRWSESPRTLAALPKGRVRVTVDAAPDERAAELAIGPGKAWVATRGDAGWSAVIPVTPRARSGGDALVLGWRVHDEAGAQRTRRDSVRAARGTPTTVVTLRDRTGAFQAPSGALFEDATLLAFPVGAEVAAGGEPLAGPWRIEPARLPLRRAARITLNASSLPAGAALYRLDDDGWTWIGADVDTVRRTVSATSRQLGTFAVFADTIAPRVPRWELMRDAAGGPYSRWAIEALVDENGSGVDARGSWFEVDGRRVPAEWDPEAGRLRWRPGARPAAPPGRVTAVIADRAGNLTRADRPSNGR